MDEVENQVVEAEITPAETSPQEESTDTAKLDEKEKDFRALRQSKKEAERKAYEAERTIQMQKEMMAQLLQQVQKNQPQAVDELDSIPQEDFLQKGKVEKLVDKKIQKVDQLVEEKVNRILAEREKAAFAERLRAKYNDFDDVVNPETMDLFEQQEPELARSIAQNGDPYSMALQTYKYIKTMGLLDKVPNHRRAQEVEKKLEKNSKTVQSPQVFDKRPMAQVFQMTEQDKKNLREEMYKYAAMAGGVPEL